VPSFAVVPATSAKLMRSAGEVPLPSLLHASQRVRLVRPLAAAGALEVQFEITALRDQGEGKHAFATITGTGTDATTGELVVETQMGLFVRGGGGFGGPNDPRERGPAIPDRQPDHEVTEATRPEQALLYRLTGDRNPLHSDPAFARRAGFERPILHGLATYGFATRALVAALCDGDPDRVRVLDARFAAPVVPGEVLTTRIWRLDDGSAVFRTSARSDGGAEERTVLDAGVVEHT
jgi:acyl dehydratase